MFKQVFLKAENSHNAAILQRAKQVCVGNFQHHIHRNHYFMSAPVLET